MPGTRRVVPEPLIHNYRVWSAPKEWCKGPQGNLNSVGSALHYLADDTTGWLHWLVRRRMKKTTK